MGSQSQQHCGWRFDGYTASKCWRCRKSVLVQRARCTLWCWIRGRRNNYPWHVTTLRVMITKRYWISRQKHKWIINIVDLWLPMCVTARFGWNLPQDGGKFFHAFLWLIACLDSMQTFLKTMVVQTMEAVLTNNLRLAECQIGSHPLTRIRKVLTINFEWLLLHTSLMLGLNMNCYHICFKQQPKTIEIPYMRLRYWVAASSSSWGNPWTLLCLAAAAALACFTRNDNELKTFSVFQRFRR